MKKLILTAVILCAIPAMTQQKEPTVAELKQQIAAQRVEIAQLKIQLLQAQQQLIPLLGEKAQQELQAAQEAAAKK